MMSEFTIYAIGICSASVCSSLPAEEVKKRMSAEPTGVSSPWQLAEDDAFADGTPMPCLCNEMPETHKHYLFHC